MQGGRRGAASASSAMAAVLRRGGSKKGERTPVAVYPYCSVLQYVSPSDTRDRGIAHSLQI